MIYTFTLDGKPIPQGRPKVSVHGGFPKVYYSSSSNAYRKALVAAVESAKASRYASATFPIQEASVRIGAFGMNKNADPDNLAKQVMDALVTAGVLAGDEWPHVPRLVVECYESSPATRHVHITVESLTREE